LTFSGEWDILSKNLEKNMKTFNEAFQLIKNGEWHPVDLAIWLDLNRAKSYNQGFEEGFEEAKELYETREI
jgi:hypothetical protein